MIHSISFENFFSIRDRVELSFSAGKQSPDNDLFFVSESGKKLSKMLCVIGNNGSGKTNMLKAMVFLSWFVTSSFKLEPDSEIFFDPFAFTDNILPTTFEIVFELSGVVYKYQLNLTRQMVIDESLYQKESGKYNFLFKRKWNAVEERYEIRHKKLGLNLKVINDILRNNASLISTAMQVKNEKLIQIGKYFANVVTNVDRDGRDHLKSIDHYGAIIAAAGYYNSHHDDKVFAERIMNGLDLGLNGVRIDEFDDNDDDDKSVKLHIPWGIHLVGEDEYVLPFYMESSGTQNLFILLRKIAPVLKSGGVAVIDEFEVDLHPHMVPKIVKLFLREDTNPCNAQLLFSCHSHNILNVLDKTQIVLVEKDDSLNTNAWRLDSVVGVRRDDNILAKYNSGTYGAVPNFL